MNIEVTAGLAFSQHLEDTIQDVEFAIVMEATRLLSPRPGSRNASWAALEEALQAGPSRVMKHFESRSRKPLPLPAGPGDVIFRVRAARAFGQRLEKTMKDVERAIIFVAYARFKGNQSALMEALHVKRPRIKENFAGAEDAFRAIGRAY